MGRGQSSYNDKPPFPQISEADLNTIINGSPVLSAELTVKLGELVGKASKDVASAQIRTVFSNVRLIESDWSMNATSQEADNAHRQLILLKSKLRYQVARKPELDNLVTLLNKAIDLVKNRDHFQRFVDFFEAILAYHKVAGGKN